MIVGLTSTFITGVFATRVSAPLGRLARAPCVILSYIQASFDTRTWLSGPSLWSSDFISKIPLVNIKQPETFFFKLLSLRYKPYGLKGWQRSEQWFCSLIQRYLYEQWWWRHITVYMVWSRVQMWSDGIDSPIVLMEITPSFALPSSLISMCMRGFWKINDRLGGVFGYLFVARTVSWSLHFPELRFHPSSHGCHRGNMQICARCPTCSSWSESQGSYECVPVG